MNQSVDENVTKGHCYLSLYFFVEEMIQLGISVSLSTL